MSGLGTSGEDRPVTWGLLFIQLPQMFPLLPMGGGGREVPFETLRAIAPHREAEATSPGDGILGP